jgi:hypothetical protein
VRLVDVPPTDVLEELTRQSNAEIRGRLIEIRSVTASFDDVPLAQALGRLFPEQNFALVYGRGGRLMAVRLLGGTQSVAVSPPAPKPAGLESLLDLISRHPPVPVSGPLADAIGAESATLVQLLDVTLHHEDANVRTEAVRSGMATLQAEPELRSAVVRELNGVDSDALTTLLRTATGNPEDVARDVLGGAQIPELRLKASSVLQRLRVGQ